MFASAAVQPALDSTLRLRVNQPSAAAGNNKRQALNTAIGVPSLTSSAESDEHSAAIFLTPYGCTVRKAAFVVFRL
jgi:hypothetical protein